VTDISKDVRPAPGLRRIDEPLLAVTGGFILLFCGLALVSIDTLSAMADRGVDFAATHFGLYRQLLLLGAFLMGMVICVLPGAPTVMGTLGRARGLLGTCHGGDGADPHIDGRGRRRHAPELHRGHGGAGVAGASAATVGRFADHAQTGRELKQMSGRRKTAARDRITGEQCGATPCT